MAGKNKQDIYRDKKYGPLIHRYAKGILKSGMLLDEDLEVFLKEYNSSNFPPEMSYSPTYPVTAGLASVLFSIYLSKKIGSYLFSIPSLIITAKLAYAAMQKQKTKTHYRILIDDLIGALRENHQLNVNIFRYIKLRMDLDHKTDKEFFMAFNKSIEEFMKTFTKAEYNFAVTTMDIIQRVSSFSEELTEDYNCIKDLDVKATLKQCPIRNISDCKNVTRTIQDIHIFMSSKLLSYLGIVFCSPTSKIDGENFELFLNVRLPHVLTCLKNHTKFIRNQFTSLQNSVTKVSDYKSSRRISQTKNVSNKLRATLINSINNLQVILEKSQGILQKLEDEGSEKNGSIDKALLDVKNHTLATYESLDLLCRLYGILSNAPKVDDVNLPASSLPKPSEVSKTTLVSYDDEIEAAEERYELYLDKDAKDDICVPSERSYDDQSGAYLNLMLRELKQSLKKHERFVEAKKRRGSEDEEEGEEEPPKNIPTFNVNALDDRKPAAMSVTPPPPPMPKFNVTELSSDEFQQFNNRAMLQDVMALSRQRIQEEEVFGDSDNSD